VRLPFVAAALGLSTALVVSAQVVRATFSAQSAPIRHSDGGALARPGEGLAGKAPRGVVGGKAAAPRGLAQRQRAAAPPDGFETVVKPFLAAHCFGCHGNKGEPEKGLNLESFGSAASLNEHRERWDEVVQKLRGSEMPPIEEEQPPEDQRQAVATWIAGELDRIDRTTPPDPGRVTARRLNRTEYNNTISELLGVDIRPADDFPQDDSGYGFDNIGDVLSLSPALMEKYITAADRVARQALFGPARTEATLTRLRSEGRRVRDTRTFPESYDVTGLSLPNAFHAIHRVPVDGEYAVRVVLGGVRPKGSDPIAVSLWVDHKEVGTVTHDPERSATFSDDRQDFGGQTTEFRVRLKAGDRWLSVAIPRIFEGLPARFGGPNPSTRPEPPPAEFKPPPDAPAERLALLRKRFDDAQAELAKLPFNAARVSAVEIAGPYSHRTGASALSLSKIYTCGHRSGGHQTWCASRIVRDLASRAFRRPVTDKEVTTYVRLVREAEKEDGSFDEGLAVGIQALLVSPDFLFRIERERRTSAPYRITQHELATRLSYFLWASMPDAELRQAADAGTLRQPAILTAQVRRMLRDPKSRALAEHFGGQWLQFRALESITRDRERFPDFEDYLRLSMRHETELFFEHIIRADRSILDFIDGRYSFLNERLARHYGLSGVSGPQFRRVDLAGSPRGGVVTHASVLTVSSYATRTSPVLRGKWILENLLNAPPPEPPPDVPNLDEVTIGTTAALRDQLEAHRKNPTCASCHRRMDPLGFGLENFDAVGAWRTMDGKFPVDASGTLPDGRSFTGPEELRTILKGDRDAFARALTSKLLTYALGRGLERYDTPTVKRIASRMPRHGYRFSGLILEIVNSLPFQSRRSAVEDRRQTKSTE
jgi:mono/diheme cytochrome c family protein